MISVKRNLRFDFGKSDLKFKVFLIEPFRTTVQIRIYCTTCLHKHNNIRVALSRTSFQRYCGDCNGVEV